MSVRLTCYTIIDYIIANCDPSFGGKINLQENNWNRVVSQLPSLLWDGSFFSLLNLEKTAQSAAYQLVNNKFTLAKDFS